MQVELVDSFVSDGCLGNPAGVSIISEWPEDRILQRVATEAGLPETAFVRPDGDGFEIRWFSPGTEVALCGHATLASALIVADDLKPDAAGILFWSRFSGRLPVRRHVTGFTLNFPASEVQPSSCPAAGEALGVQPVETFAGKSHLFVFRTEEEVRALRPDFDKVAALGLDGVIVTAPSYRPGIDFVSRYFAPHVGVPEDPVTGYAHTLLTPFWSQRLGRTKLTGHQVSERGGIIHCRLNGDRVDLTGEARRAGQRRIDV